MTRRVLASRNPDSGPKSHPPVKLKAVRVSGGTSEISAARDYLDWKILREANPTLAEMLTNAIKARK